MDDDSERYRAAYEGAFDAVLIADEDGHFVDANPSACALFGADRDDLVGRSLEAFTPEDYDVETGELDAEEGPGTLPLIRADGERRTVECESTPLESGERLVVLRDVTEREERKRKLRETRSRYRQLVEQNLVGIYVIQDREFAYVNPRLAEIFGETPEAMVGRSPFEWIDESDHERVRENLRKREAGDVDSLRFTVAGERSDGEPIEFEVFGGRVEVEGETAILGTLRDVTERERRERELTRKNERLERFADILSHDLRNPLNVAQGRLELAREECDSEHLDAVVDAHARIEAMIEDLLLLSREGETATETEPVDVGELAETCWGNVETEDATLVVETSAVVEGDRGRIRQLLENLIRNSVEHGGADVTVRIGDLDDGFYVEDDGGGIPEEERDRIFESGYSTASDGMGIGLSIVERIAEAHGWEVAVTESEDGGARFEFVTSGAG